MGTIPAPNIAEFEQRQALAQAQQPLNAAMNRAQVGQIQQQTDQARMMAPLQQEAAQNQLDQQEIELQDARNARALGPKFIQKDGNGNVTGFDNEGYYNALMGAGMDPAKVNARRAQNLQLQESINKLSKDQLDLQNEKNQNAYETVEPLRQAAADPKADIGHINEVWGSVAPKLKALGMNPAQMPASFQSAQDAQQRLTDFETEIGQHKQMLADAETAANTAKANAEAGEKNWQKFPELGVLYNTATGETRSIAGGALMTPGMMESKYVALQAKQNAGQPLDANDAAWKKGFEKFKTLVPQFQINMANQTGAGGTPAQVAQRFGMTPDAFDQAAEKYYQTGNLPPIGRGGQGQALNKAIMNRTAELHQGASLAAGSAEYKANAASLSKLQTNFDQVSGFENTAQKNLDLYLSKLKAIPDLGVKFLNVPMRQIDASMIGSDNYQAMKAAQQTAASETAKVLASANASGVLSDTQKKEAEDVLSGNLSYSAAQQVVATLKQDFANRHQSYQDQIADIKGRMGAPGANTGGGAQSTGHKIGDIITQNGHNFKATKVDQSGKVLAADPVQ